MRKWAKVSLRGGAQVASHEPRLSFWSAPLRFAPFGLSHCSETLGLPWQGKNLDSFFFIYLIFFRFLSKSLFERLPPVTFHHQESRRSVVMSWGGVMAHTGDTLVSIRYRVDTGPETPIPLIADTYCLKCRNH